MAEPVETGVIAVEVGGSLALFADRTASVDGASAEALAEIARAAVARRARRAVPALFAHQEHTALSFVYGAEGALEARPHLVGRCDAMITAEAEVALTVRTADCLPVVIAGGGVTAMVHAGWRGLSADILGSVVRRIAVEFGVPPAELAAAIGVGIGPCHYPVGTEVIDALSRLPACDQAWRAEERVDLRALATGRLHALGLERGRVRVLPGCTACSQRHHSFRRDGAAAGRQWSAAIRLEP
jgi:YfiH family protein